MGFVAVAGVVEIDNLGLGGFQNLQQVGNEGGPTSTANLGAGVGELDHGGVVPQNRRLFLLFSPDLDKFRAGFFGERAGARGPGSIRDHHAGEADFFLPPAGADPGEGHDFEVIGMGTDTEVGRQAQGLGPVLGMGGVAFGRRAGEFHAGRFRRRGWKTQSEAAR